MAGQGFKDFSVGEVLTSADVDGYLMQQSVMRFADSAARGSALGTAVGTGVPLAEGMVAYLDDVNQVQVFDGTSWATTGKVLQVVSVVKADTFTTTSTSYTDVTGLSVSITPSSATSKVFVSVVVQCKPSASGSLLGSLDVLRDSTSLIVPTSPGSRTISFVHSPELSATSTTGLLNGFPFQIVDSPATTSSVTYKVQAKVQSGGTIYINRSSTDSNSSAFPRSVSTITLMEVAG